MAQPVEGTDRLATKPLHLDEALMQLDSIGSEFLVFFNAENGRINVRPRSAPLMDLPPGADCKDEVRP